jgi:hypothetical protein
MAIPGLNALLADIHKRDLRVLAKASRQSIGINARKPGGNGRHEWSLHRVTSDLDVRDH